MLAAAPGVLIDPRQRDVQQFRYVVGGQQLRTACPFFPCGFGRGIVRVHMGSVRRGQGRQRRLLVAMTVRGRLVGRWYL